MTTRAVRIVAASLFGLTAGTSLALAQATRPWVDPPADLTAPAASPEKPRVEEPAPVAAKAAPDAEVGKAKSETKPEAAKVESEAPAATGQVAESKEADARKAPASKPARAKVATKRAPKPQPRVAQRRNAPEGRQDGLVVMQMQTLQFPDGRTMTVLTRPGEAPSPWAGARDAWR
jgi:hypothetical protein